ncbi:MAG: hypothetical protein U0836_26295 [Pirellulales bacterium]
MLRDLPAASSSACCCWQLLGRLLLAQADQAAPPAAERALQRRPRLPPYYGRVATVDQRAALDKIQESYAPKIEQLRAELDKLLAQRDAELRAALGPEQQKQLDELTIAARDRRRTRSELRRSASATNATPAEAAARTPRPAQERAGAKP